MNLQKKNPQNFLRPLSPYSAVIYPTIAILIVMSVGTLGYHFIENWSFLDSLYMTVTTMTTVGYGEVHPLSEYGRIFSIGLIITSIGIAGYVISKLTAFIVEGEVKLILQGRKMDKQIAQLKDHIILCGVGRTGFYIAEEFYRTHTPFVVIDQDENALEDLVHLGSDILYIKEDSTQDETLLMAGVKRAHGLVTTLSEDKDNVFVVLCARSLNPKLRIVARLVEEKNEELLRKAGADHIVSPNAIGGLRMASVMLRPTVVSFLDEMLRVTGQTLRLEEIRIEECPELINKSLGEANIRQRMGLLVVAIKSHTQGYQFNPGAKTILRSGDVLIVIGPEKQLDVQYGGVSSP